MSKKCRTSDYLVASKTEFWERGYRILPPGTEWLVYVKDKDGVHDGVWKHQGLLVNIPQKKVWLTTGEIREKSPGWGEDKPVSKHWVVIAEEEALKVIIGGEQYVQEKYCSK